MSKISFNPSELKVFTRATAKEATVNNSTNPFGISFKGKRLDCDVFESQAKKENISFKSKIASSAVVGTLTNAKNFMSRTMAKISESVNNAVASVGNVSNIVNKISDGLNMDIVKLVKSIQFSRNPYNGKPVNQLREKFDILNYNLTNA